MTLDLCDKQVFKQTEGKRGETGTWGPPPVPGAKQYFTAVDGQQKGPYPLATLKVHAGSGSITPETLVWCEGMDEWTAASSVDEVNALFNAAPPPLPPRS